MSKNFDRKTIAKCLGRDEKHTISTIPRKALFLKKSCVFRAFFVSSSARALSLRGGGPLRSPPLRLCALASLETSSNFILLYGAGVGVVYIDMFTSMYSPSIYICIYTISVILISVYLYVYICMY